MVSKSPKTAVQTKAVQLNLKKNMDRGEIYQILPSIITHVYGAENTLHVIQTKAADTSTKMQTGSTTRQAMKIYITTKTCPENVNIRLEPEKRCIRENLALLEFLSS